MGQETRWNAGLYEDKHSFVWRMTAGLLDLLNAQVGERILDVGCGTGHLTAQIAETGALVTGIDRSREMIRQAQEKYSNLQFRVMDAREITLPESFDAVFSNAALHWIKEPERVIAGIARSLRPGARFVAEFGGKGNIAQFLAAASRAWSGLEFAGPAPHPWYYPSVSEYAGLLEQHGFEVTYATLFDRPTPLEDGERGLRNWIEMFLAPSWKRFPTQNVSISRLRSNAKHGLSSCVIRNGSWTTAASASSLGASESGRRLRQQT